MTNIVLATFSTFIEILKLGKLPAVVASCVTWVLLLLPVSFKRFMSIDSMVQDYRSYIGLCAVVFPVYFLSILIYEEASRKIRDFKIRRMIISRLKKLSEDEKGILVPYIQRRLRTQYYAIDSGVANGLTAKHILFRTSNVGVDGVNFPYNIQDIAYDYLLKHPELVELEESTNENSQSDAETW